VTINLIGNSQVEEWVTKRGISWKKKTWYHINALYNAPGSVTIKITERDTGSLLTTISGVPATSIFAARNGLILRIAGENIKPPDNSHRLAESQFENVEVTAQPGDPFCAVSSLIGPNFDPN